MKLVDREFYYCWEWRLKSSPAALWPLVADTNRFNLDTGLPAVERVGSGNGTLPNARRRLRFFKLGMAVEWEEEPFEWVEPHCFGVVRRYTRGPVAWMQVRVELQPGTAGGSHLSYQVQIRPRNLLGWLVVPVQVGIASARRFARVFQEYDRLAGQVPAALERSLRPGPVHFVPGGDRRLAALHQQLLQEGGPPDLVERLVEVVAQSDDLTVRQLRPYALADTWGVARRGVLELCLLATRVGLLEFEWDLLCPLCRGAKARLPSLGGIVPQVHCDTCQIDFTVDFDRSVELTFHPNPSVRSLAGGEYCVAGPRVTPHVAVQQLLGPKEQRVVQPVLEPGRYRWRILEQDGGCFFEVAPNGMAAWSLKVGGEDEPGETKSLGPKPRLELANTTEQEQLFILERLAWTDQAATAAEVTALQRFRDLFASEALRPGERISVGSLTVLFTDLCGSTRLYHQIGDAPAFGLVMDHFDVLLEAIADEEGAIVKTIGDAVMAVFRRPVGALRAVLRAQRGLAEAPGEVQNLRLKAGVHYGPCIAVTLNERLDYFGSTVNIASRLEHLSAGGDIVVSSAVYEDPEVVDFLAVAGERLCVESLATTLKGFDETHFALWRVRMA